MTDYIKNIQIDEEDTQKDKYLTFAVANEEYGVEIKYVAEIIKFQDVTSIPDVEPYIKGVINLRGKIIPVMDMRLRLNKEPKDYHDRTCIIVVSVDEITLGFIVEKVCEVLIISEDNIVEPPDINRNKSKYIKSIGKTDGGVKLILDCEELIYNDPSRH